MAVTCLKPLLFTPALELIRIPDQCPEDVANELRLAFAAYWFDAAAGLNHLRKAVELIMDRLRIARWVRPPGKKRARLTLDSRIQRFRQTNRLLADRLEAVKWLGNVGSHSANVSTTAFFNACDLLEDFVETHFAKRGQKIVALTKKVIQRRGRD